MTLIDSWDDLISGQTVLVWRSRSGNLFYEYKELA